MAKKSRGKASKKAASKVAAKPIGKATKKTIKKSGKKIAKKAGKPDSAPYVAKSRLDWIRIAARTEPVSKPVPPPHPISPRVPVASAAAASERFASLAARGPAPAEAVMVDEIAAGSFVAPATATGLLRIAPENGSEHFYGTAWAVGPRTLVTAAHNVYGSFGIRNWIGLALGHNAVGAPARYVSCCGYIVPPSWQSDPSETNPDDYAILLTQQPLALPPSGRNFGLAAPKNDELTGASFNVLGYAGVESNDMRLYWAVGAVTGPTDDPSTFYYEAFNGAGMSGGPIYFESGGDHYAVGVHRGVAPYGSGSVSVARKIGEPTRDEIRWHALNPACPS